MSGRGWTNLRHMPSRKEFESFETALFSAVNGDLEFAIEPETLDTLDDLQNVGEQQEFTATIAGVVASDGTGDIVVTVTSNLLEGGEVVLDDITVGNNDDQDAIATAIVAALVATDDFSADGNSGDFKVTRSTAVITIQAVKEAAHDETLALEVADGSATFDTPLAVTLETTQEGVAPYMRRVKVSLTDANGNVHKWFTGVVPVTIAEVTAGDGEAEVVGGLSPTMNNGFMEFYVLLRGTWAAADTNTLSVTQATILGETVTAVTSEETTTTEE